MSINGELLLLYIYTIRLYDKFYTKHDKCGGRDLNLITQCGNNNVQPFWLKCKYNLILSLKKYIYHSIQYSILPQLYAGMANRLTQWFLTFPDPNKESSGKVFLTGSGLQT